MAAPVDMCIKNRIESGKLTDSILQFLRGKWHERDFPGDIERFLVRFFFFPSLAHVFTTCLLTRHQIGMSRYAEEAPAFLSKESR